MTPSANCPVSSLIPRRKAAIALAILAFKINKTIRTRKAVTKAAAQVIKLFSRKVISRIFIQGSHVPGETGRDGLRERIGRNVFFGILFILP